MSIYPVRAFQDNYIWVLVDEKSRAAICVDPGEAAPVLAFLQQQQLTLDAVLLTHHHPDHVGGLEELLRYQPALRIYGPRDDRLPGDANLIRHDDSFHIGIWSFQVLFIPGHTASHICFFEPDRHLLFCGDTLFSAGCGRVFDGTMEQLHDSLALLKTLPDDTQVYCGHEYTRQNLRFAQHVEPGNQIAQDYLQDLLQDAERCSLPSTMAMEKQINPFLRLDEASVKTYAQNRGCTSLDSLNVFKQLREDKNHF